jgi:hypothetical protein
LRPNISREVIKLVRKLDLENDFQTERSIKEEKMIILPIAFAVACVVILLVRPSEFETSSVVVR